MASIFGEPVVSLAVVVPTRIVRTAPELLRAALHALHGVILARANGAPVHFADPARSRNAPVGENLAWVEALLGLAPSEPIREIAASDVPAALMEDDEDDDEDDEDELDS
ncbi:hypothetical protein [Polyangium sp. 15x6]|uniref:hypothetical protein n=1 Tax=Polyangium sp. 15x6 TaxID=3042687 RepID=UPI00249CB468|nr:hypothetical protein [Polyangium sp. 15x6]MDI3284264.1 hypothetical protein [Polyangium sp. 15x6]